MINDSTLDFLIEQTQIWLNQNAEYRLTNLLSSHHPDDIAQLILGLPSEDRIRVWPYIPEDLVGDVLLELPDAIRSGLMSHMDDTQVARVLTDLHEDEQADLIQDIPNRSDDILQILDDDRRQRLEAVLYFPENSAGGIMDVDAVSVRSDVSVRVVLRYLRQLGKLPEGTNKLFITDRQGHLLGQLLLSSILTVSEDTLVNDIFDAESVSILANLDSEEVARLFIKHDLISAPVVDEKNRLLGRITVEDIMHLMANRQQERITSAPISQDEDAFSSVLVSSRYRALWLGVNLLTALLASWVIGHFEAVLIDMVALAVLMPVVASMGGIAGTQSMSLVIRSLALGQLRSSNEAWLLQKEMRVGLLNGVLWAIIISAIAWLWFHSLILSGIIAVAIFY